MSNKRLHRTSCRPRADQPVRPLGGISCRCCFPCDWTARPHAPNAADGFGVDRRPDFRFRAKDGTASACAINGAQSPAPPTASLLNGTPGGESNALMISPHAGCAAKGQARPENRG